ncbi:MAG: hypothetical protein V4812_02825 [Pseudomonadota bacterium]
MRAIAVVMLTAVLAGCGGKSYDQRYDDRQNILGDFKYGKSLDAPVEPLFPGGSPLDEKIDPGTLETAHSDIQSSTSTLAHVDSGDVAASKSIQSKWGSGWESFGDWHVKALHDDMDTVTHVRLFTDYTAIEKLSIYGVVYPEDQAFGFEIFDNSLVVLSPTFELGGKGYRPYCENDMSSVSVDGSKAIRLTPVDHTDSSSVDNPAICNSVDMDGAAIAKFLVGRQAKIRLHYDDGFISLNGFKAAWSRALQLGM